MDRWVGYEGTGGWGMMKGQVGYEIMIMCHKSILLNNIQTIANMHMHVIEGSLLLISEKLGHGQNLFIYICLFTLDVKP